MFLQPLWTGSSFYHIIIIIIDHHEVLPLWTVCCSECISCVATHTETKTPLTILCAMSNQQLLQNHLKSISALALVFPRSSPCHSHAFYNYTRVYLSTMIVAGSDLLWSIPFHAGSDSDAVQIHSTNLYIIILYNPLPLPCMTRSIVRRRRRGLYSRELLY